jgi:hypothetical protein
MKLNKTIVAYLVTFLFLSFAGFKIIEDGIPNGWFKAGSSPESYEIKTIKNAGKNGENALDIKSIKEDIKGFGTLMQNFSAEKYLNKRVRLSGDIKSRNVDQWAGLWMRIDGKDNPTKPLGFDNMMNRSIKGTTDWKKYSVVLDVPSNSNLINIGILLAGKGEVWVSNLKFDIVDKSVPVTDLKENPSKSEPSNLDFKN